MGIITERLIFVVNAQGITQATGQVSRLQGAFGGLSQATGVTKGNLAAMGATGVVAFLGSSAQAASNLNEQVSASSIIFGDGADAVQSFADDASNSFGISERAALEAANSFASLFKNAGAMDQDAARFSVTLTKLGADIASLRNMSREDVALALRSGLTGELEPLRRLGIIMNDNTVKAKALQMGLAGAGGEVDDGAKVFARLNLILEQTGDAQGNYALTANEAANAQQRAKAELEDFQATIGQLVTPAIAEMAGNMSDMLDLANKLLTPLGGLGKAFGVAQSIINPFGFAVSKVTGLFGDNKSAAEKAAEAQADYAADAQAAANVQREQAVATEAQTKALEKSKKALDDAADAQDRLAGASRSREMADRRVAEAERELNDLTAKGRVDKEAVARANERIASTSEAVTEAQEDEARSAREVESANRDVALALAEVERVKKGASKRELREAELDYADALRDSKRAALDSTAAEQALNSLRSVGVLKDGEKVATADDVARAELELADKKADAERTTFRLEDAEKRLKETREKGKPGSKDLQDALDVLAEKQETAASKVQAHADAQKNVNDKKAEAVKAHDDLRKVEEGDPEFDEKLAKLRQDVADAHYNAAEAKKDEKTATENLNAAEAQLAIDRRIRKEQLDKMLADEIALAQGGMNGRGGTAGPGTGPNPSNNPLGALAGLSAMQAAVGGGMLPGPTFGEQAWQRAQSVTYIQVNTGADPNAVVRALELDAGRAGGSPRR